MKLCEANFYRKTSLLLVETVFPIYQVFQALKTVSPSNGKVFFSRNSIVLFNKGFVEDFKIRV